MLWSHCTTERTRTGETPFSLAFDVEVIILLEVGIPSFCIASYSEVVNQMVLCEELDLVEKEEMKLSSETLSTNSAMQGITIKGFKNKSLKLGPSSCEKFSSPQRGLEQDF